MSTKSISKKPFPKCWFPRSDCQYKIGSLKCRTCRKGSDPNIQITKKVDPKHLCKQEGVLSVHCRRGVKPKNRIIKRIVPKNLSKSKPKETKKETDSDETDDTTDYYSSDEEINEYYLAAEKKHQSKSKVKQTQNKNKSKKGDQPNMEHGNAAKKRKMDNVASSSKSSAPNIVRSFQNSASSSENITDEIKSLKHVVKNMQQEMNELKNCNNYGFGNFTRSAENDTNGVLLNRSVRLDVEEENTLLKDEIRILYEKLGQTQKDIIKKGEDVKKQKASHLAKIVTLKESLENVEAQIQQNYQNFVTERNNINREAVPDVALGQVNLYRCKVATCKRDLEKYDPTPPPPKPDPYKTPSHLQLHSDLNLELQIQQRYASLYGDETGNCIKALDRINPRVADQKKNIHILSAVLHQLSEKNLDVQFLYPTNPDPDLEKMKEEIAELEISVTKKAEKEYEVLLEKEKKELLEKEAREKAELSESSDPQEGCSKSSDPQEGSSKSSDPQDVPSISIDSQEGCSKSSGAHNEASEVIDLGEGCSYH